MRLRDWLEQGAARLSAGPHPERARRDAETLLLHHTGKSRAWLMAHAHDEFAGCGTVGYALLLDRRAKGEPIQYIVEEAEFYGLPFRVSRDVLIPRPETEHVVERVIELAAGFARPRIVDVGTGSAAIAVALAAYLPYASFAAIDVSPRALAVARENVARHRLAQRVRLLEGDLLAPAAGEQFDIVASNPPYVPESDCASLAVEVREFEPAMALFAGEDGLAVYRRLIPQGYAALAPGGFLVLEIGCGQQAAVGALLADAGFEEIAFAPDLQAICRVASARRPRAVDLMRYRARPVLSSSR